MEKFLGCVIAIILYLGVLFLVAWGFQVLWNWIIPDVFKGPTVSYWEAYGLLVLLSIVGSFFRGSGGE